MYSKFPFFGKKSKVITPKWGLLFDKENKSYTKSFKSNLIKKLREWLVRQDGEGLINECQENGKDDYFNIIQFYLRERFPLVALYEKKQNATIVLMRSLAVGFALNIVLYFIVLYMLVPYKNINFSLTAVVWVFVNVLFSSVFYSRFKQDKKYHAMYIYETFIATKRLLNKRGDDGDQVQEENAAD